MTYAQTPRADLRAEPSPALLLSGDAASQGFLAQGVETPAPNLLEPYEAENRDALDELGALAYKISYVGSFLLTADQVIRSMDSVLNRMELTRPDGTELRLNMRPSSGGFKVMLKLSRPIDF